MGKNALSLVMVVVGAAAGCTPAPTRAVSTATGTAPPPASPAPTGTVLVTLGTRGGPMPTKDRSQSSNLLIVNGKLYLIDAGDNVTRRIVQSGNDFKKVETIFLTHLHADHTAGLATLIDSEWEYTHGESIDIYGSGVDKLIQGMTAYLTPNAEIRSATGKTTPLSDIVHGHEIQAGVIYQDASVKVIAAENTHFHFPPDSVPYGKYRSYAYRFETPDRVVVFTGDTGVSDAVTKLAAGADVLVAEVGDPAAVIELAKRSGVWQKRPPAAQEAIARHLHEDHLPAEELGKMAAAAGVKSVVMTHLVTTVDPDDTYQRYIDAARKFYAGPIYIAKDLKRF